MTLNDYLVSRDSIPTSLPGRCRVSRTTVCDDGYGASSDQNVIVRQAGSSGLYGQFRRDLGSVSEARGYGLAIQPGNPSLHDGRACEVANECTTASMRIEHIRHVSIAFLN